jgi:hypothetical protein
MGNALAEGLEYLIPSGGKNFDLIVLGLQESTYYTSSDAVKLADDIKSAAERNPSIAAEKNRGVSLYFVNQGSHRSVVSDGARSAATVTSNEDMVPSASCFGQSRPKTKSIEKNMYCVEMLLMQLRTLLGDGYVLVSS